MGKFTSAMCKASSLANPTPTRTKTKHQDGQGEGRPKPTLKKPRHGVAPGLRSPRKDGFLLLTMRPAVFSWSNSRAKLV
jgi:hypothetical protein